MADITPSPCGVNAALDEAKAKMDELKAKISGGLDSISDLGGIADTIKAKLAEVNIPKIENVNLQAELAKLPYLTPAEYNAAVEKIKNHFSGTVDNLEEIINKIPKPVGVGSSSSSLFEKLQNLANNIQTTTQDILNSLSEENIANAITDLCKSVPNVESKLPPVTVAIVTNDQGEMVKDTNGEYKIIVTGATKNSDGEYVTNDGDVITILKTPGGVPVLDSTNQPIPVTKPAVKADPPVTPQSNPKKETAPPDTKRTFPAKWVQDDAFITKVKSSAKSLNCDPKELLACMAFETGRSFDPGLKNFIGATGLIQFIESTAKSLGTTTAKLAAMTRDEQMDWVLKYFKAGPVAKVSAPKLEDLYMQILWPKAVGKPDDYVLFEAPSKAYEQNKGLDKTKKGYVTKADAAAKVRDQLKYVNDQLSAAKITV